MLLSLSFSLALAQDAPTPDAGLDLLVDALVLDFAQDGVFADRDTRFAGYQKACDAGLQLACTGWDVQGNLDRAEAMLGDCSGTNPVACLAVAWRTGQKDGAYDTGASAPKEAYAALKTGCDAGLDRACLDLATVTQKGVGTDAAPDRAVPIYRAHCNKGVMPACRWLGTLYQSGRGVAQKPTEALQLYTKACDGGYAGGCNNLGLAAELGVGVERDPIAASDRYLSACKSNYEPACINLVRIVSAGAMPTDPANTLAVLTGVCDNDDAAACFNVGRMTAIGVGTDANEDAATPFFEKSCTLGLGMGCGTVGMVRLTSDPATAAPMLEKGCDAGLDVACAALATLTLEGTGVRPDAVKAASLFQTACEGGLPASCRALAEAYKRGIGVDKDKKRSKALIARACELDPECSD